MDLTYDDDAPGIPRRGARFLTANKASFPTKSYDTAEGFEQHRRWDRVLFDAGLSVITWPEKYGGRDATLLHWVVFEEEYFRAGRRSRQRQRVPRCWRRRSSRTAPRTTRPGAAQNGQR